MRSSELSLACFSVKDGVFRQYRGARDKDSFISFVEDRKWTQIEEVAAWTHPDSVQMTLVSYFFKLSMVLRNVHSTLTEEYEFPYWVSYVAFAVATILLGAILGLLLVCCIDCIFPPRSGDWNYCGQFYFERYLGETSNSHQTGLGRIRKILMLR